MGVLNQMSGGRLQDVIKMCGGNPEQAFRAKAREMGIDPDEFINQLK